MGDTGSPEKHLITLYVHEKMRIIDVKSDVFNQIDVGNEIKAYEYKERITIEQEKKKRLGLRTTAISEYENFTFI